MIVTIQALLYFMFCSLGEKFLIRWYRGYLISVSKGGRGGGARGGALAAAAGGSGESMTLTIYDIQNQFLGEWYMVVCLLEQWYNPIAVHGSYSYNYIGLYLYTSTPIVIAV